MKLIRKHNELNLLKESDDFDWINDIQVNPFQNIVDNVIVWFDRPITRDESQTLLNFIEQAGIVIENNSYATVNTLVRYSQTNGYIRTYVNYSGERKVGYGASKDTFNSTINFNEITEYEEYNASDLFGNLPMNESDDFDWIKDVEIHDYIQPPYFISMKEYGLRPDEYEMVLSKIFNQTVTINGNNVYDNRGNLIYYEESVGYWQKYEYDDQGNLIYYEDSVGSWIKQEYDDQGNLIYIENSNGVVGDYRNLNESDDFDWIKGIDISDYLEPPYFKNMVDMYGLSPDDYEITLSKVFNQPITIKDKVIYNNENKVIYIENNRGDWEKYEYDADGNEIHYEDVNGHWYKKEYDGQGNQTYYENAYGFWVKSEYDDQGNLIYKENSNGYIMDNRNINESDDMDWIKGVDITNYIEPPYFKNMKEYGLSEKEYEMVLSKVFNEPVTIKGDYVYDTKGNVIYFENSNGSWGKWEYDANGNEIYGENSYGYWYKSEYDNQGNKIYFEDSDGEIEDNRNLNESDDFDWIRGVDINPPYFKNTKEYGLSPDDYESTLSKIFNQPVTIRGNYVYNNRGDIIYYENNNGFWYKKEYDDQGNQIYFEDADGDWYKKEYDDQGNKLYYENSDGYWGKSEYDNQGNKIYFENSYGYIRDNRHLNESEEDGFEWIRDVDITNHIEPPYFENMKEMYGLRPEEYELVLSKVFNQPVTIKGDSIYDTKGNVIYFENSDGFWVKWEYDNQGNQTYYEDSDGYIEDNR